MINLNGDVGQIRRLDNLLWLQGYACASMTPQNLDRAYALALEFGYTAAENTPLPPTSDPLEFDIQLLSYGIKAINTFFQTEESGRFAHAYYNEEIQSIVYDETFATDVLAVSSGYLQLTVEDIRQALLLHELFHHLEIKNIGLTYEFIKSQCGRRPPKASRNLWRDIAAFAFVHTKRPSIYCQILDLCWLKLHLPERYVTLLPDIQQIIPQWNI